MGALRVSDKTVGLFSTHVLGKHGIKGSIHQRASKLEHIVAVCLKPPGTAVPSAIGQFSCTASFSSNVKFPGFHLKVALKGTSKPSTFKLWIVTAPSGGRAVSDGAFSLNRTFNGYGEIETESHGIGGLSVCSWALGRNRTGRIISKSETARGAVENYAYTYDAAGRLEAVTKDGFVVEEYAYDINGTRIFERNALRGIAGKSFTYSDEDHLLTAGDTTYQYDLDGFLTTRTKGAEVTTYDYSSRGELLSISLPGGRIIEYIHDPLGRRIVKKINGVTVEKYLWSGLTRLLAVYDSTGALKMRFEYADGRMPYAMTKNEAIFYLFYDQVGSLRAVTDASGNVVKQIDYDAFGIIIEESDTLFEIP
jgi:YD repeat-containing protein